MRLSVLLPAYNAERTLAEAVESVLGQTHRDFELVLIDDGSTDGTRRLMERFARRDGRVRIMAHPNIGMGEALNRAAAAVDADWLVRMDADDVMMPTRLERQVAFVDAHPGLAVASCLVYYIDRRGRVFARSNTDLLDEQDFRRYLRSSRLIAPSHPGVVMSRRVFTSVGGYRPRFWPSDDLDLWARIAEAGHLILVQPEYLMRYRIHALSVCVSDPRRSLRQIRWVNQCMLARRAGLPEPSLEEFLASERGATWLQRANRWRRDTAQAMYKSATHHYATSRYRRLLVTLGASLALEPSFGIRRVWSKVVVHKLCGKPIPFSSLIFEEFVPDDLPMDGDRRHLS